MNVAAASACEQKLVSAYYLKSVSATTFSFCLHRTGSRVRIYTASNKQLQVLEAVYIRTRDPVLCKQKENVVALTLFK